MPEPVESSSFKDNSAMKSNASWKSSNYHEDFCPHIPKEEFDGRIKKLKNLLEKHGIDALVLFSYDNKYYYGGYRESNIRYTHRWRHCVVLSQKHDPVFVGEWVLSSSVQKTTWIKDARYWSPVKLWGLPASFMEVFISTMRKLHLDKSTIGLEYGPEYMHQISFDEIRSIEAALPDANFVSADGVVWEQRMVKTAWETDLIREMCEKAGRVLSKGWKTIRPGISEREVHRVIWEEFVREDMYDTPCISNVTLFLCGSDAPGKWRLVTTPFYDRVIKEGDQGFADSGPTYKGYWTDFQRSFYVGEKLPSKLADLSKWGRDAYLNTAEKIRPGMMACEVFELAKKEVIRQDTHQVIPIEFVGHGIGLLNHEAPWLAENDRTELLPGMVLCIEVGCFGTDMVYFGNMPEDMWLVTETGLELLGIDLPREIWLCG
jgi:Xaa-Pro aminopeptidase